LAVIESKSVVARLKLPSPGRERTGYWISGVQLQPLPQPPLEQPESQQPPRFFLAKSRLKKPPRARPLSQQSLPQSLAQQDVLAGTSLTTHFGTIRQQVTVSQCGTQTRTVRVAW
jgi:hypothetical protein